MKKIKIVLLMLLIGIFGLSYFGISRNDSAKELLLVNVEALSFVELEIPSDCAEIGIVCVTHVGVYRGMTLAN